MYRHDVSDCVPEMVDDIIGWEAGEIVRRRGGRTGMSVWVQIMKCFIGYRPMEFCFAGEETGSDKHIVCKTCH